MHKQACARLPGRRWYFLPVVTFINFWFWIWGRKFITKKVPTVAAQEIYYGYEAEKGGEGAEQEPESPELLGTPQAPVNMLIQQTQGRFS